MNRGPTLVPRKIDRHLLANRLAIKSQGALVKDLEALIPWPSRRASILLRLEHLDDLRTALLEPRLRITHWLAIIEYQRIGESICITGYPEVLRLE